MIDYLITYWQFTLVTILIFVTALVNIAMGKVESNTTFKLKGMPTMEPLPIPTKDKGFWGAIWVWLMVTRTWKITKDFNYNINGIDYIIPKGFVFDGASVPKFFRSWLSPMGVLLIGGLIHDFLYGYQVMLLKGKKQCSSVMTQKESDKLFRDINIEVNGFRAINYLAYYALRLGGVIAWKAHRKASKDWKVWSKG